MKRPVFLFGVWGLALLLLQGCANMKIENYKDQTPQLDLFTYFEGKTQAYGQFQDRSGRILRRFEVAITGTVNESGDTLTLTELFIYNDGEKQTRVWVIKQISETQFIGTAEDVIGEASGEVAGNALNWKYTLDLPYQDGSIHVQFDDWMYLHNQDVMMNKAEVTKWGFKVGEVTLFFSKKLALP